MASRNQLEIWWLLLLLVHVCIAGKTSLLSIDAEGFEERAAAPGTFVISFCVPWFDPCKLLEAELISAAESLGKTSEVQVYTADCSKDDDFCASMEITSFPTIRIFDRREWARYRGPQKSLSVVSHVLKRVLDPIVSLDEQRFDLMKALDRPLLVLNRAQDDDASFESMAALAQQELSGRFFVGVRTDLPTTDTPETVLPFVTVFNALDDATPAYEGPFERSRFLDFANKVSAPLIRQLDSSSLATFMQSGLPLALLFSADELERKSLGSSLTSVAMKYHGQIDFATVDAEKFSFFLEFFGLSADRLPAFAIQAADEVFKPRPDFRIGADTVDEFIRESIYSAVPKTSSI